MTTISVTYLTNRHTPATDIFSITTDSLALSVCRKSVGTRTDRTHREIRGCHSIKGDHVLECDVI